MSLARYYLRRGFYGNPLGRFILRITKMGRGTVSRVKTSDYWDRELKGRLSSYLGGCKSVDTRNAIASVLLKHCAPDARAILDIGCAGGTLVDNLGSTIERYLGIDISQVAVEKAWESLARQHGPRPAQVEFIAADLTKYSLEASSYDVIVFNEVLYYLEIEHARQQVDRYADALSPSGLLMISLKDDAKSHAILHKILEHHTWVYGTIYQHQPARPRFKIFISRETPAYLISVLRPKRLREK